MLYNNIRRIVVFRALYLGDLLCATPALRALRQRFPEAEITLIGLPWARELVNRLPSVDYLEPFPGYPGLIEVDHHPERTAAFFKKMRAAEFDLAIQMHGDGRVSNGFVADLGARHSLGYRCGFDRRLNHSLLYDPGEHEVRRWLRLVAEVGAVSDDTRLEFPLSPLDRRAAAQLLDLDSASDTPLIGLHPGAKDEARRWPPERFAALADQLIDQYGARIVLTGGPGERELTAAVARAMRYGALDLAGKTDLGAFAATIAALDLLVTNDTGASHIACATGTCSLVLFGPSRPECWAPLDQQRHQVLDAPQLVPQDFSLQQALGRLPVEPVYQACVQMLGTGLKEVAWGA
jgi:ADP-heptose:LPS heptosyltransferase